MKRQTSLTTFEQFLPMIAHLPLTVIERDRFGGLALLLPEEAIGDRTLQDHLFHALDICAKRRGLRARRGVAVWTVNGFFSK